MALPSLMLGLAINKAKLIKRKVAIYEYVFYFLISWVCELGFLLKLKIVLKI